MSQKVQQFFRLCQQSVVSMWRQVLSPAFNVVPGFSKLTFHGSWVAQISTHRILLVHLAKLQQIAFSVHFKSATEILFFFGCDETTKCY